MAVEVYTNGVTTTLNGSINNSVTSLVVTSATGFPTSGNFRIIVESELMIVTAVSGTTFTVTRGAEGTTAASHASGVNITNILTAGAINGIIASLNNSGTLASIPSASKAGNLYFPTDANVIARDNGSTWDYYGPTWKLIPPILGNFAWINQGGSTTTDATRGGLTIVENTATNGESVRLLKKAAPSTPYTITVAQIPTSNENSDNLNGGIMLRESSSGKVIGYCTVRRTSTHKAAIFKWTNPTTFSSSPFEDNVGMNGPFMQWLRLTDDGTNRKFYTSNDGFNFSLHFSESRTTHMTADEVGIYLNAPSGGNVANRLSSIQFFHYLET